MIERVIEFSIKNRFLVILGTLAVVAGGVLAILRTPIDAIPDLSENQVIVFADWMGHTPREIEDQVTYPLSVNLQGLAGVKAVRSTSEFNFSMVNIIFEDKVDFYFARQRVLERLSVATTYLPQGVTPYLAPDATALGQIFWYTVEGDGRDPADLRAIQDWYVRYQLNSVPGVAQVASVGGFVKTYEIALDPDRLRSFGVTLGEVTAAVQKSNQSAGGNVYIKNDSEYLIRGVGWLKNLDDMRSIVVAERGGVPVTVAELGTVQTAPEARRSVLEKNGQEAVGGVVLMRYGENPLEVTRRIKAKIQELQPGLPAGVRIVPFYDRTRLIGDAIHTLARTLREEIIVASAAVLLILTHPGSAFVVVITLPLAVLFSFILMHLFHISSNIMSLSGIAISIGILVDASIVMVENATHELTAVYGRERVSGDTRPIVLRAARLVGRPIFLSIMIMLVSFLPVFALTGMEGKMFHPLAFTKTFAMIGVALLSITLVPALMPTFLRGRLRSEDENPIVRSFIDVYKPVLKFLLRHPRPFIWSFVVLLGIGFNVARHLGREFMPPLDEGSIMDMPVTIPSVSVSRAGEDLKARDAVLRSFPEVELVVGKAGRADTPTDPAPPDMVETVVNLRRPELWPRRHIKFEDLMKEGATLLDLLGERGVVRRDLSREDRDAILNAAAMGTAGEMDALYRARAARAIAPIPPEADEKTWKRDLKALDLDLARRAPGDLVPALAGHLATAAESRHLGLRPLTDEDRAALLDRRGKPLGRDLFLWRKTKPELLQELDSALQVPGWGNIWTQPIINRVDMLATGVRTMVGVKVFGDDLYKIQEISGQIADVLRTVPGAVDVFPDQIVGENYLEIEVDRGKAARYGVNVGDVQEIIETALGGKTVTTTVEGRQRFPVRVRYARDFRVDEQAIGGLLVAGTAGGNPVQVPLRELASVKVVEGPSMVKSENGLLRSYVQLNVRGRDIVGFVEEAQKAVQQKVKFPPGYYVQWSGQFENQVRAKKTLRLVFPVVVFLIFVILYITFHDLPQALLMVLAVPGALAGGVIFQAIFGFNFSVAVWVGYIAAFGMATETGIVMMVYLRDALERKGGLAAIRSQAEITDAVIQGAVHRLRPKLLTEGVAIVGLMPMLWAHGTGAEIMRPMAAPVLGGLLVADEVIDLLIPVLFHALTVARWKKRVAAGSVPAVPA